MTAGATFLVVLVSCSWQASAANAKVREFYMYRGTKDIATNPYVQENVDLADLPGALKYIHTEVLSEHTQTAERVERKYGINTITRWRVLVNNPGAIVDMNKPPMVYADFGPFVTFDYGQATNNLDRIEQFGDFVGAQQQYTPAWAFDDPYYWFSLSGFCPNLPYVCTNGWKGAGCDHNPPIHTSMCPVGDACPSKGTRDLPTSTMWPNNTERASRSCGLSQGKLIQGGLCGDHKGVSADVSLEEPTGNPSCVYSYDPDEISEIVLDDIVGLKQQDCTDKAEGGNGKCTDWAHFRSSCTDTKYKKMFDTRVNPPQLVNSQFCVEYDIHPACESDCASAECLQVPADEREVGLDFWKGRCEARANMKRAERIAAAFGVDGAKVAHNLLARPTPEYGGRICDRQKDGGTLACAANFNSGGPFCTREWGGVCTPCYIEGTQEAFSNVDIPICPLNIITNSPDYKGKGTIASCKTNEPSGKCCLYFDACNMKIADAKTNVATLPLDEDHMRLIAASQETDVVLEFVKRLAVEWGQILVADVDEKKQELREIAYWSWGKAPMKGKHIDFVKEQIQSVWSYAGPTSTTTTSGAADVPDVPVPAGGNEEGGYQGMAWYWILIIGFLIGGGGYFLYSRNQPQRRGSRQFAQELSGGINA